MAGSLATYDWARMRLCVIRYRIGTVWEQYLVSSLAGAYVNVMSAELLVNSGRRSDGWVRGYVVDC